MIYFKLFLTFFKIGAFTFGGGYAMLPLVRNAVILENDWISNEEFVDILAVSEMTPGPVSINCATFVGERTAGIFGALAATLGVVTPSVIVISVVAKFLSTFSENRTVKAAFTGIRPVVLGLLLSASITVAMATVSDFKGVLIAAVFFALIRLKKIDPIFLIILGAVCGLIFY